MNIVPPSIEYLDGGRPPEATIVIEPSVILHPETSKDTYDSIVGTSLIATFTRNNGPVQPFISSET